MRLAAISKCRIVLMQTIFVESRRVANRVFPYTKHNEVVKIYSVRCYPMFTIIHVSINCYSLTKICKIIIMLKYLVIRQVLRQIEAIARFVDLCSNMGLVLNACFIPYDPVK